MWFQPELKVDQSLIVMAICMDRQQEKRNSIQGKITEFHLNIMFWHLHSQQKLEKKMLNAQGGKGWKDFRTKIIDNSREKAKARSV